MSQQDILKNEISSLIESWKLEDHKYYDDISEYLSSNLYNSNFRQVTPCTKCKYLFKINKSYYTCQLFGSIFDPFGLDIKNHGCLSGDIKR